MPEKTCYPHFAPRLLPWTYDDLPRTCREEKIVRVFAIWTGVWWANVWADADSPEAQVTWL